MTLEKSLANIAKSVKISKTRAYQNILEWIIVYPNESKEKFIEMLKFNFEHLE